MYVPFEVRKWNINSVIKRKIMNSKKELIEKYKIRIGKMERESAESVEFNRQVSLQAKISVYKMVIIDLQE